MATLGRYEILDKLGTGSMGTVYRVRDSLLGREVALKTIRTGGGVHPELRERFYREAQACARLQHPSIVVIFDLGEAEGVAYIAMELLAGSDLRKLIDAGAGIPLAVKLETMAQVAEGLAYAHRSGIVHRDVKPSNIFLVGNKHAKILDFGIARLPASQLTMQGNILGTPNYMAPEQILGQPIDGRADLFSAAVVLYEFLTGQHPFQGDKIPQRIVEDDPDPLYAAQRKLPVLLERIFARALAKDPDRRYRSGDDFAADLRAVKDALLQNSSPTFSRVELPSEREARPAAPAPAGVPAGQDAYEWRLSELMRLIPEFEDAIAQPDVPLARRILAELEAIGAADTRSMDTVRLCRARLADIDAPRPTQTMAPGGEASASGDPGTSPKTCAYCGATNRGAAVFCIKCGGRLPAAVAATPVPGASPNPAEPVSSVAQPPPTIEPLATAIAPGPSAPPPAAAAPPPRVAPPRKEPPKQPPAPPPRKPPQPPPWQPLLDQFRRRPLYVGLTIAAVAGIILLIVVLSWPAPPVPPRAAVGTARPAQPQASLYDLPTGRARKTPIRQDDQINLLELPVHGHPWIHVQPVRQHKPLPPGYMRVDELKDWDSKDAGPKLALIDFYDKGPTGTEGELQKQLIDLQALVNEFPGNDASRKAQFEMAQLEIALAQIWSAGGKTAADWQKPLESARARLNALANMPDYSSQVQAAQQQIDALMAPPTQTTSEVPAQPDQAAIARRNQKKIDDWLGDALKIWQAGASDSEKQKNLAKAAKDIENILKIQPENQEALDLKNKIQERSGIIGK